ncbi:MAG: ABC transporter permease [Bacteroidales bacterium]|nr:ABC transporter permease [Bacteroidales bacterium]MDD3961869.1 ABC transporter permease [Bacteroidales bacterium]HPE87185.1 ABC transporter permease [Bacteroidales bacterium]
MALLLNLGLYLQFLGKIFRRPEKGKVFRMNFITELENLGLNSIGIVVIISVFMGAVVALQVAYNTDNPLIPAYLVGYSTRQSMILEFSPTIIALILAGKIGSNIASEIGTMRVTEQIDALEVMGINAAGHLVLPKVIASLIVNPVLVIFSIFVGTIGGWIAITSSHLVSTHDFLTGIYLDYSNYDLIYALIKTVVFAFLITTISGFYGFYTQGGALEVGRSSTKAVVSASIMIIISNLILTQLLLI